MIKGPIQEEGITIANVYASNIGAPQCMRQTLTDIKGEIDSHTIIVGDFNTPFTPMERSSKQKIVRKHLIGGSLCAVLALSGNLWPLLIPEYSGSKRRDMPFLGLKNRGISFVSFSLW